MTTELTLRQELVLALGDEEIRQAAQGSFTSQRFGERLADLVMPLVVEVYQMWTDQIADSNLLHQRLQEEIARANRAEAVTAHCTAVIADLNAAEARIAELERGNKVALAGIKIEEQRADTAEAHRDACIVGEAAWKLQAERAEVHSAQVAGERHRAEARIAAALAILRDESANNRHEAIRALTEGTPSSSPIPDEDDLYGSPGSRGSDS